ncbi:MAG: hypothetical protein ABR576_04870 [Thermoanaerobaculia bacterium]
MIGLRRAAFLFRVVFFAVLFFAAAFRPAERAGFFMAGISSAEG